MKTVRFAILVVDDEYDITWALKTALTMEGYSVEVAYNGRDAIESLKKALRT